MDRNRLIIHFYLFQQFKAFRIGNIQIKRKRFPNIIFYIKKKRSD